MILRNLFNKGVISDVEAEAMLEETAITGREHFLIQQIKAIPVLSGKEGADEFQENSSKMLAVEIPFMWGWSHAYAKTSTKLTTPPSMRASVHMIKYLMMHHEFGFKQARAEASEMDKMWNAADPLFDAISQRGEQSFSEPNLPWLGHVIAALLKS